MITILKIKHLVAIGEDLGILLEDGSVLVQNKNDFVNQYTGEVFRPITDMRGYILGFTNNF